MKQKSNKSIENVKTWKKMEGESEKSLENQKIYKNFHARISSDLFSHEFGNGRIIRSLAGMA